MRIIRVPIAIAVSCIATLLIVQLSKPVRARSSWAGTWEGKMNDLPGIDLKIEESEGKIKGIMIFYFQERSNANEPWHVASESPVPLLVPHVGGKTRT